MKSITSTETILGKLIGEDENGYTVALRLTVVHSDSGDEAVSDCRASGKVHVADGSYVLQYFYPNQHREKVRIVNGTMLTGGLASLRS